LRARANREDGQILILVVLAALIIVGSAGLAVDVGRLYATKAELSRAVDAAALAGVLEFNGTAAGLTSAGDKAQAYVTANEPTATSSIVPDGSQSVLRISASKSVRLYFLPIFGIDSASVSARATAGFSNQTLDAVMVIDSTYSMYGAPLANAKDAANNFKDTLLGSSPSGNVVVGVAPFRGCYRNSPLPSSKTDCIDNATQVQQLTSNLGTLESRISSLAAGTVSATNVCTGLAKGFSVLDNSGVNHETYQNNRRFLVLLSDGDNVYFGNYTYQNSPPSPDTIGVGGTNYACQPPNSCSGWGSPCFSGTASSGGTVVTNDGFESGNFSGGSNWGGAWTTSGNDTPVVISTQSPEEGSRHARLRRGGTIQRMFSLAGIDDATLKYHAKATSFESGDNVLVQVSADGSNWETLRDHNSTSGYNEYESSLEDYAGDSSVYIRFLGSMGNTTDQFYIDDVRIVNEDTTGYLNGQDGQDYTDCDETPSARERQLDVATLNLANALKAQEVEIYVVAFGACPDTTGTTAYNAAGSNTCTAQANPIVSPPASGRVGDTTTETTANHRLLKCIASSRAGTNDHYFYADEADDLPQLFTTIAAQIAHRLVE
jgi:Flp pilus assembly protein TadG